jgi:signal peptidase II
MELQQTGAPVKNLAAKPTNSATVPASMRKLFLYLSLPLFALDFATKQYIVNNFQPQPPQDDPSWAYFQPDTYTVIPGFFDIVRVHNTGVAFGMGNGETWANIVFGGITIGALALIWWLARSNAFPTRTSRVAVALLLAGIFGNLLDRLVRGYVVDFLHVHYKDWQWPSFNVADSCICVAAVLLFLSAFQKAPAPKGQPVAQA